MVGGEWEGAVLHDKSDFSGEESDDDMGENSFGGVGGGDVGDGDGEDCVWCRVVHRRGGGVGSHRRRAVKHVARGRKTRGEGIWGRMWGELGIMGIVGGW